MSTHLREELVLVVPDDGVGHEVDGLEGVDADEGVELDVGLLEGDERQVQLPLHRLQVRAQLVRLEHAQSHLQGRDSIQSPKLSTEVRSSELDYILEVDDYFHLDIDDVFELERVLELIFIQ